MAVLMIGDVPGQTEEGFDSMIAALGDIVKQAPGFIMNMSHPTEGGWRVIEVWQSKADATQFFAQYIAPNLPPGITPKRTFYTLHSMLMPDALRAALDEMSMC
jgi:hypothetical protein